MDIINVQINMLREKFQLNAHLLIAYDKQNYLNVSNIFK